MPIYCEIVQLVVPKDILKQKYTGGIEQFKIDFHWGKPVDHEDNELLSIGSMNNSFSCPKGLHYDEKSKSSMDFVIASRYGTPVLSWETDWCDANKVYIWHKDCRLSSYKKMMEICKTPVKEVMEYTKKKGLPYFKDIYVNK